MLDETEFLSPHGVRSVSRHHLDHPYEITLADGKTFRLKYEPGEGETRIYGGNSNWSGTGVGAHQLSADPGFAQAAQILRRRFPDGLPDGIAEPQLNLGGRGRRIVAAVSVAVSQRRGGPPAVSRRIGRCFDDDPNFRDRLQFFEYFHGDTGRGCGASHQTGWTAVVAALMRTKPSKRRPPSNIDPITNLLRRELVNRYLPDPQVASPASSASCQGCSPGKRRWSPGRTPASARRWRWRWPRRARMSGSIMW